MQRENLFHHINLIIMFIQRFLYICHFIRFSFRVLRRAIANISVVSRKYRD